jgi:hypothetical protein
LRSIATAPLSPVLATITMLVVGAIVAAATIGVLLIPPAAEKIAPGGPPTSEAVGVANPATSSTAAASATPATTIEAVNTTATGGLSTIVPEPALAPPTAATVAVPPSAEPERSAQSLSEALEREVVAAVATPAQAAAPAKSVPAALPAPASPTPEAPPVVIAGTPKILPDQSRPAAAEIVALLARGDALFVIGDFASARQFYERAANAGDGHAALRLGETYDPAFLAQTQFMGVRENASVAAHWYQRALEPGVPEADILLRAIAAETGRRAP